MIDTIRRLGRWLITPRLPMREAMVCDFCERDHHIHDVRTGQCLTQWCECEVQR